MLPAVSLPISLSLDNETFLFGDEELTIVASSETPDAPCPICDEHTGRVQSRYGRLLADLPWATLAVLLRVGFRKFCCDNPACPCAIFAERSAGIAHAGARRTERQRERPTSVSFLCWGEAGARSPRAS